MPKYRNGSIQNMHVEVDTHIVQGYYLYSALFL